MKKLVVNEEQVDLLLDMLKGADVTDENAAESETLLELEGNNPCLCMYKGACLSVCLSVA